MHRYNFMGSCPCSFVALGLYATGFQCCYSFLCRGRMVKVHKATAAALAGAFLQYDLRGDNPAVWPVRFDRVLVRSAWLQSPDIDVGFAQLVLSIAPPAAARGTVAWMRWCHLLRQWHIQLLLVFLLLKSRNPGPGNHWEQHLLFNVRWLSLPTCLLAI